MTKHKNKKQPAQHEETAPVAGGTEEKKNTPSLQEIADALGEEFLKKRSSLPEAPAAEQPEDQEEKPASETAEQREKPADYPMPSIVEDLQKKIGELEEEIKRLVAENRNQKMRLENDFRTKLKFANELLLRELVLVKDDIEKAISFAPAECDERTAAFVAGIRHLDDAVGSLLRRYGVEPYEALGQLFDPSLHEAIRVVDVAGVAANTVTAQHVKGYRLFDRTLRPAVVEVASGKEPLSLEESSATEVSEAGAPGAEKASETSPDGRGEEKRANDEVKGNTCTEENHG